MDAWEDSRAKFRECKRLLEVEYKNDPETEPYRSKYKAQALLLQIRDVLNDCLKTSTAPSEQTLFRVALTNVLGLVASVCADTEDLAKAEECLTEALAWESDPLLPEFILGSVQTRNQLGFLCSQRSRPEEAKKWLEEAEKLYVDFRSDPCRVAKLFSFFEEDGVDGEEKLEVAHTLTKFYLAQVYGVLKDLLRSAVCCHETLKRQLMQEYEPIEWALNSATLSQFFMERLLLKQARHHLAAASYVLDKYEDGLKTLKDSQEEMDARREELRHRSADVSRCWAKYGIFLLEHSKNRLNDAAETPEEQDEHLEKLWFDSMDLSPYENEMSASAVMAFEDAREVFLVTQRHLNRAKEYYTLEDRASDHIQIVLDHTQLFRHLSAFEPDEERQAKMMKKRVSMLEVVLKELNPRYYVDVCRQLWFELGETYHDLMQIRFQKAKDSGGVPAPQELKKINTLAEASLRNFKEFVDSLRDKKTKELAATLPEELLVPTLVAHFYMGRLYYKYITQDRRKQIENTTKAYECFKYVVDKCEEVEKAKSMVGEELNISREMMTLLQMKALQL